MTGPFVMLPQARRRMKLDVERTGTPIVLHWVERVGGMLDKVTNAHSGQAVSKTETVRAFVHVVGAKSMLAKFAELTTGDALIDMAPEVKLAGREDLRFEIAGDFWTQKKVSDKLIRTWDALHGKEKLMQTVALEPMS